MNIEERTKLKKLLSNTMKAEDFNPEWLRGNPGFENYTDDQANDFIETMKYYCSIAMRHTIQQLDKNNT